MKRVTKTELRRMIREEFLQAEIERSRRNSRNNLSENFITDAIGGLAGGAAQNLKNTVCTYVLEKMGVPEDHFMGRVICNTIENLDMSEFGTLIFGAQDGNPGRCKVLAQNLLEGLSEALLERLRNEILPEPNSALYKLFGGTIEEAIINGIVEDNALLNSVSTAICDAVGGAISSSTN